MVLLPPPNTIRVLTCKNERETERDTETDNQTVTLYMVRILDGNSEEVRSCGVISVI